MLAAIAIPNVLRARIAAKNAAAVSALQSASAASQAFYAEHNTYPQSLGELYHTDIPYIDKDLASGKKYGYNFKIIDTNNDETFLVTAMPGSEVTGASSFCAVEDGVVRSDSSGRTIWDYSSCRSLRPYKSSRYKY